MQVKGKTPTGKYLGAPSILTKHEEQIVVDWILKMSSAGFPVTKEQVIASVTEIVRKMGRPNRFKDGIPGRFWWEGFRKRHPQLSIRVPQNLTASRAAVTEAQLRKWFAEVRDFLEKEGCLDAVADPMRVFNADESAFFLNPKGSHVVVGRGEKNVYSIVNTDDKECLTVLVNINAAGLIAPPMVIFKNLRLPNDLVSSVPKDWGIGRSSESGWMTGEHFFEYIGNCFEPWLTQNNIPRPVIFFVDGHVSHLTLHLSELCYEKKIVLVALPPNATHIMQPCDIAVFRTLKAGWKDERSKWRLENVNLEAGRLKKVHFCGLLDKVIKGRITPDVCRNAFRKAGLLPWDPDAIDYAKIPCHSNVSIISQTDDPDEEFARKLDKGIGPAKLELFRKCRNEGRAVDIEDTSLFQLWMKLPGNASVVEESSLLPESTAHSPLDLSDKDKEFFYYEGGESFPREMNRSSRNPSPRNTSPQPSTSTPKEVHNDMKKKTALIGVPSPFKSVLFWPEESSIKSKGKRKAGEKLPAVVTSFKWRELAQKKEAEKQNKLQIQTRKKEEREKKKKAREETIKRKKLEKESKEKQTNRRLFSSESSESSLEVTSGESVWDETDEKSKETRGWQPVQKYVNEYVVFKYDGKYYPGKITTLGTEEATISSMQRAGRLWKWPDRPDILPYPWNAVIGHINTPKKTSKTRNVYMVDELLNFLD